METARWKLVALLELSTELVLGNQEEGENSDTRKRNGRSLLIPERILQIELRSSAMSPRRGALREVFY
jgi:hypothetical protein